MDVNLTISLMRGQMGVVIEKAVNAAVETVLGEMIRVVSLKFEEFRREMNAKDKENENIRNMLEVSRCQMKTMRRYVNALTTREDRQALLSHRPGRPVLLQYEPGRVRTAHHSRDMVPPRRASATNVNVNVSPCVDVQNPVSKSVHIAEPTWEKSVPAPRPQNMPQLPVPTETYINPENYIEGESSAPKMHMGSMKEPTWEKSVPAPRPQNMPQLPVPTETFINPESYIEGETSAPKMHMGSMKGENSEAAAVLESEGLVAESSDPLWGQTPPAAPEVEHTDTVDSGILPVPDNNEGFSTATEICIGSPPIKVKQEEGEVEIVHVKEEPATSECSQLELCQQAVEAGPSISLELPLAQQCHQLSMPSIMEPGFLGMDPSTCSHETMMVMECWMRSQDKRLKNAERTRRYRAKLNADPVKREAMLEHKRQQYQEKKAHGEIVSSKFLPVEKRLKLQQKWAAAKRRQRRKITPFHVGLETL